MSNFYIVKVTSEGEFPISTEPLHEEGVAAAKRAKTLTEQARYHGLTEKYQPRRIEGGDSDAWKKREAKRFTNGIYRKLPPQWDALSLNPDHFVHIDPLDETQIAYFADDKSGILDRPTKTKPGRYLKSCFPDMNQEVMKAYIAAIDALHDVQFAYTREEFRKIYENGPSSCMAQNGTAYTGKDNIHPVEAYAGGDLALAYLKDKTSPTRFTARAVCYPAGKVYGRIYGDIARLEAQLKKAGFKPISNNRFPAGIKIAKIPLKSKGENVFVRPFLDNFISLLEDKGDHALTLDSDDVTKVKGKDILTRGDGGNNAGHWTPGRVCPKIGNVQPKTKDWVFVHGPDAEWSPSAVSAYSFKCAHTGEVWESSSKYMVELGAKTYSKKAAESIGTFKCAILGKLQLNADLAEEKDGVKISKAGIHHRDRLSRMKAARAIEVKREEARIVAEKLAREEAAKAEKALEEMRAQARIEAAKVKAAAAPKRSAPERRSVQPHHIVISGAVPSAPPAFGTQYVFNANLPQNTISNEEVFEDAEF